MYNKKFLSSNTKIIKNKIIINKDKSIYGVLDIETYKSDSGELLVYAIGFYTKYKEKDIKIINYLKDFYIEGNLINQNIDLMLMDFFYKLSNSIIFNNKSNKLYLFAHNMGSFDGYLIMKILENKYGRNLKILMDNENKLIEIKFNNIILRDSYRIFPLSLAKLSKILLNKEKIKFDHNKVKLDLILKNKKFYKDIIKYLENDLILLYNIIINRQLFLLYNYNIPLRNIYSSSNLAFNIFRVNFLNKNIKIPIIGGFMYKIIEKSYYGGINILYKDYGKNLYVYDVNSLYPYSMLKDLPLNFIKYYKNIDTKYFIDNNLFGYFNCIIYPNFNHKLIINRDNNNNIKYNSDKIINNIYFSEEIKY
jgi:hypothetical protein